MSKQTEALKLALEALTHLQPTALTSFYTIGNRDKAITAIREALAEQPAQQEPVEYWTVADGWVSEQAEVPAAAWIYPEFWDHCKMVGCGTAYRLPGDGRLPLYTSPPASKPWVGLTVDEVWKDDDAMALNAEMGLSLDQMMELIEWANAKLREKNT